MKSNIICSLKIFKRDEARLSIVALMIVIAALISLMFLLLMYLSTSDAFSSTCCNCAGAKNSSKEVSKGTKRMQSANVFDYFNFRVLS